VSAGSSPFAALRSRNFRLLWSGQFVSFAGTQMQHAAVLWHVSLLAPPGRKALALGIVGLVRILPIIVFSMVSGVVADALDRRRLMLVTQVTMGAFSAAMAVLTFSGAVSLWHVYLLAALGSAASAFDQPARQSLIPSLVPREDLANAISLNMIMVQMAAVGGPSLAGLVIAGLGIGWAYAFDALSFGAAILSLVLMRDVPQTLPAQRAEISLAAALEGLRFVFSSALIRSTMLLDFFATFFSSAIALLPIFAQDVLHVGARGYGWLYGAPAVGAVSASAVMVRIVDRVERRGWLLIAAVMCYGLATVGFGMSRSFWLTFFCLAMIGASDTVSTVLRNVIRQLATPDRLRGRMTSVNMIFFQGGPQLGELESGLLAQWIGAPLAVVTGGIGCLAATGVLASATPVLRRYRRETHV
jgi:MFS family permease